MLTVTMKDLEEHIARLTLLFAGQSNAVVAAAQVRYMKNQFIFMGLPTAMRRKLQKEWLATLPTLSTSMLTALIRLLWEQREREFQYVAIEIAKNYQKHLAADFLSDIEYMIRTKSWWDTVDFIAKELLGMLLFTNRDLQSHMDQWIVDPHMWIRRSAILYQLKYKQKTNSQQLFDYCKQTMYEKEFFIRKAIGWALRHYARTNPHAVRTFVQEHEHVLSNLSKREALKHFSA